MAQSENRSWMRWLPPFFSLGFVLKTRGEVVEFLNKEEQKLKIATRSLHDDVLLDSEECSE